VKNNNAQQVNTTDLYRNVMITGYICATNNFIIKN